MGAASRVAPSITAPRIRRERNHAAESSPKWAAALSPEASTRTESAGTAPSIPRERGSWGEDGGGGVGEPAVGDDELEHARAARLGAKDPAPRATVVGERPPRAVASAQRPDRRLDRELGAAERGVDALPRERVEE